MKKKIVMVFGTFDVLHLGHVFVLEQAKLRGDTLIAVVARDKTVAWVKKNAPKYTEDMRKTALHTLRIADKVVLGSNTDIFAAVRKYKPDVICLGYDQETFVDDLRAYIAETKERIEILRLRALNPHQNKSSKFTTPPIIMRGVVKTGLGEGRRIGYPTANISVTRTQKKTATKLESGVYAGHALYNGHVYSSAIVVGMRTEYGVPLIEAHLLNFSGSLVGKIVTVCLERRLRALKEFKDSSILKMQIAKDISQCI